MLVPTRGQVSDQAWRGIAGGDGGRRAGLDLVPPLREADGQGQGPLYYERDQHWTAAGHAVAAQAIARFLRDQRAVGREQ